MRIWTLFLAIAGGLALRAQPPDHAQPTSRAQQSPVVVELFTSEGCSDCPPADQLLEQLERSQPVPGAEIIALSEHVDYFNNLGWRDPFSSLFFTHRQENYVWRFHLNSAYTPEMVVDGIKEFVGSDGKRAQSAIAEAARDKKVAVRLVRGSGNSIRVEVDPPARHKAEVYLAVAENSASSQVSRGENQGRMLHHIAVVRRIDLAGKWDGQVPFTKEVTVNEASDTAYRLVAFVQEVGGGRVIGAAIGAAMLPGR
jgi:hypothetical protein